MHGSRFLSLGACVALATASCALFAARAIDVARSIERPFAERFAVIVQAFTRLLAIAFPASANLSRPLVSTDAPRVIGLDQVRSFLGRRAERHAARLGGGWSDGGLQLAA